MANGKFMAVCEMGSSQTTFPKSSSKSVMPVPPSPDNGLCKVAKTT